MDTKLYCLLVWNLCKSLIILRKFKFNTSIWFVHSDILKHAIHIYIKREFNLRKRNISDYLFCVNRQFYFRKSFYAVTTTTRVSLKFVFLNQRYIFMINSLSKWPMYFLLVIFCPFKPIHDSFHKNQNRLSLFSSRFNCDYIT